MIVAGHPVSVPLTLCDCRPNCQQMMDDDVCKVTLKAATPEGDLDVNLEDQEPQWILIGTLQCWSNAKVVGPSRRTFRAAPRGRNCGIGIMAVASLRRQSSVVRETLTLAQPLTIPPRTMLPNT